MAKKILLLLIMLLLQMICAGIDPAEIAQKISSDHIVIKKTYPLYKLYKPDQLPAGCLNAAVTNRAYENYAQLRKLYFKWHKGLFGSKSYYKRYLTNYLVGLIGGEILTDYEYFIVSPEGIFEQELVCIFKLGRWLKIAGEIDLNNLQKIIEPDPSIMRKWWRSKKFLSVQGRVKKFRLDTDKYGELIIVYLEDIRLIDNDNSGRNSKKQADSIKKRDAKPVF